ncbi:J domain-containing protein [Erythrobacter sp. YJ-T3-07]|uniref:DnaJ C-terminal domain-containing protein n=1 Tax=Erythrobacter sp. YJ-T3-07 TaxID=2793063 RepID=UPI0018D2C566|nr:J domain-containing protein [Erythrobacter sp. YJ-T3-07]MBH1942916.1 J domain-containing protein [Erythrobacter sp. YJ-T3-07]
MADAYDILGIGRSASEKEIKSAYRTLAKQLHPDRNKDNPKAAERFSDITKAYDLLSDKEQRARYDRGEIDLEGNPTNPFGGGGFGGGGAGPRGGYSNQDFRGFGGEDVDLGDLFEGLFGGGRTGPMGGGSTRGGGFGSRSAPPRKGADIAYRLRVPFVDAARLIDQRITLSDGKTIDLKLPAGVESGTQMRLRGKGEQGPGGAGDALVTVEIDKHPHFERDGDRVRLELPITLSEAVRGGKVRVPTVDGPVMLTIKPGTSGGTTMRLSGKGFSRKTGGRGDQLVTIQIVLPEDIGPLQQALEGWTDTSDPRADLST